MSNATVILRTGTEVPRSIVIAVNIALEKLYAANPIALYEAVQIARNPAHVPFGDTPGILHDLGILQHDGRMHDLIREVVLASSDGYEMDLRLVAPCEEVAS